MKTSPLPLPGLYGLHKSNRDFAKAESWGKNSFNNAFPIALVCYMNARNIKPVYLQLNEQMQLTHGTLTAVNLFNKNPDDADTFFAFESDFVPYRSLVVGSVPRADVVVINDETGQCTRSLEIKLTALPNNATYDLGDALFGCELVVRPDTIVYLALSLAYEFKDKRDILKSKLSGIPFVEDWVKIAPIILVVPEIARVLDALFQEYLHLQRPLVWQPVWKTVGRTLQLHTDALDVFVWSDFAFTRLFFRDAHQGKLSRGARSIVWLAKMLIDFAEHGKIDYRRVIDSLSYNTKNDKAFAVNGRVTQPYMACSELVKPRINKEEIRHIILGGGEKFLSPERRLDAALLSTPGLFE